MMESSLPLLSFKDVSYRVKSSTQPILNGVSGRFLSGELTAVMGPSGSGKSSLLEILAGIRDGFCGVDGQFCVKRVGSGDAGGMTTVTCKELQQRVTLVPQTAILVRELTVKQMLMYCARLQTPKDEQGSLEERVNRLLRVMRLEECAETVIGNGTTRKGCSGGEIKRASIAATCLSRPSVLILDEPLSGLDHDTGTEILQVLRDLMKEEEEMSVVCSIHQPSKSMFEQFEMVMVLCEGSWVYQGPGGDAVGAYFYKFGYVAPPGLNPADGMMDILGQSKAQGEDMSMEEGRIFAGRLVEGEVRGAEFFVDEYNKSGRKVAMASHINADFSNCGLPTNLLEERVYPNSVWYEVAVLYSRNVQCCLNNTTLIKTLVCKYVAMALVLGTMFFNTTGNSHQGLYTILSLFWLIVTIIFMGSYDSSSRVYERQDVFVYERKSGWYRVWTFYLSFISSNALLSTLSYLLFGCLVYSLSFFEDMHGEKFCFFILVIIVYTWCLDGFVYMLGVFIDNRGTILAILNIMLGVLSVTTGFGVLHKDLPVFWQWVSDISMVKHALTSLMVSELDHEWYGNCQANATITSQTISMQTYLNQCEMGPDGRMLVSGSAFLGTLGYEDSVMTTTSKYVGVGILFVMGLGFHIMSYMGLLYRSFDKHPA